MALYQMKEEWRSVLIPLGGLSAMMKTGVIMRPELFADN